MRLCDLRRCRMADAVLLAAAAFACLLHCFRYAAAFACGCRAMSPAGAVLYWSCCQVRRSKKLVQLRVL